MIRFNNGGILIQHPSELPNWVGASKIFVDAETTSGDPTKMSINPWHNCDIAGIAVTVDTAPFAIYFDWMRASEEHKQIYAQWLQDLIWQAEFWINHNIKYDAHVLINYMGIKLPPWLELICTLTKAKLVDSDRNGGRGGYGLDALSYHWLKKDISAYEKALGPYLHKNKDYGAIPADILGEYACQDVLTNRDLYDEINRRLPERCNNVAITEMKLTKELVYLEQTGMKFDPLVMKMEQYKLLNEMCRLDEELAKLVGREFRPSVSADCNEVLVGHYGLPIVKYTTDSDGEETDNASFDKHALAAYAAMPYAPHDVIEKIRRYRKLDKRNSGFMEPWQQLAIDGVIHATYNQLVRTGRMSCSDPNAQQLDDFMASLIIPGFGNSIISTDASQIEFRWIVHYIQDAAAIAAYNNDPDTDFHQLVADLCQITRKPAKTINFGTAFGEGMKKVIAQLASNEDIVKQVKAEVESLGLPTETAKIQEFTVRVAIRGKRVYETYHRTFPTLKQTTKDAENACKLQNRRLGLAIDDRHYYGYITNAYGRDRHLPYAKYRTDFGVSDPYDRAWLAFSTLNQASAADLVKERMVYLMREVIKELPIRLIAVVHDELVFTAPTDLANDPRTRRDIVAVLESPAVNISVPIRWAIGVSENNWLDAATGVKDGGKADVVHYNKADACQLNWAR